MAKSRREFIKLTTQASLGLGLVSTLPGCAHLDDWFMGDTKNDSDRVVIIGGGLSGLTAAYHLKKSQVPFRIYEGSKRVGGRIWTLQNLNVSSMSADLGGERVELDHVAIQSLTKELKIPLGEISGALDFYWSPSANAKEWQKDWKVIQKLISKIDGEVYGSTPQILNVQNRLQFPKAQLLDSMNAEELLQKLNKDLNPSQISFLRQLIRYRWGVESSGLSSLELVHFLRDANQNLKGRHLKIKGGTGLLVQALYDRLAGVLPERVVKFEHKLVRIQKIEDHYVLAFQNGKDEVQVKATRVICTLPFKLLRQVRGWESLDLSENQKKMIAEQDLGNHTKFILGFKERTWRQNPTLGSGAVVMTDLSVQNLSECGIPAAEGLTSLHGLLQAQIGGEASAQVGPHSVGPMLKEITKIDGKIDVKGSALDSVEVIHSWGAQTWSQGSRAYRKPGQFQISDFKSEKQSWLFAGENQSQQFFGTMNGAVQSGLEAAQYFVANSVIQKSV